MIRLSLVLLTVLWMSGYHSIAQTTVTTPVHFAEGDIVIYSDKPYYHAGDIVWFSLFLNSKGHQSAFADITDSAGNSVQHGKIAVKNGVGNGSFILPDDMATGTYELRAHTKGAVSLQAGDYSALKLTIGNFFKPGAPVSFSAAGGSARLTSLDSSIGIVPDKVVYGKREKIKVNLVATDGRQFIPAAVCASVFKVDTALSEDQSISAQVQKAFLSSTNLLTVSQNDTTAFYGKAEKSYSLDEYTRFNSMEEVFREFVREVGVIRSSSTFRIFVYDDLRKHQFEKAPLVLLDGLQVHDMSKLMALDPLKLKRIEVVPLKYFLGKEIYYGVVNICSSAGDLAGYEPDANAAPFPYEKLQPERRLNLPIYDTEAKKASRLPDFRTTLFWAPVLHTSAEGKTSFEFYSSDLEGDYLIVINGLLPNGTPGRSSARVSIQ